MRNKKGSILMLNSRDCDIKYSLATTLASSPNNSKSSASSSDDGDVAIEPSDFTVRHAGMGFAAVR